MIDRKWPADVSRKGQAREDTELDGVPDCVEPSEACHMRRNEASSNLRSRPTGESQGKGVTRELSADSVRASFQPRPTMASPF